MHKPCFFAAIASLTKMHEEEYRGSHGNKSWKQIFCPPTFSFNYYINKFNSAYMYMPSWQFGFLTAFSHICFSSILDYLPFTSSHCVYCRLSRNFQLKKAPVKFSGVHFIITPSLRWDFNFQTIILQTFAENRFLYFYSGILADNCAFLVDDFTNLNIRFRVVFLFSIFFFRLSICCAIRHT